MRLIRLTDARWPAPPSHAGAPPLPTGAPRGEADRAWHARERALARQRVRDACAGEDPASRREQAWRLWVMLVEEGRMG